MLRAPLFFSEHIRRGRISLLTDAAVPSPPAPPASAKPRAYLRGFSFRHATVIELQRSCGRMAVFPCKTFNLSGCPGQIGSWPGLLIE